MLRERVLALEHTCNNPIVVDNNSNEETAVSDGVELETEETLGAEGVLPRG